MSRLTLVRAPLVIAHRGASGLEPENTLRAFARALEEGATWIELDVHVLDGRVVVLHDNTVDRTTDGHGHLKEFTFERLRTLDAGRGEKIPCLEEVLELVAGRARVNVELKGEGTVTPTVAALNQALVAGPWDRQGFVVSSFEPRRLARVRELAPAMPVALLLADSVMPENLESATRLGAEAIHVGKWAVRGSLVREAHERGLAVRVFTVNHRWEYEMMRRLGVDGVFTDRPDCVLTWGRETAWLS